MEQQSANHMGVVEQNVINTVGVLNPAGHEQGALRTGNAKIDGQAGAGDVKGMEEQHGEG